MSSHIERMGHSMLLRSLSDLAFTDFDQSSYFWLFPIFRGSSIFLLITLQLLDLHSVAIYRKSSKKSDRNKILTPKFSPKSLEHPKHSKHGRPSLTKMLERLLQLVGSTRASLNQSRRFFFSVIC